MTTGEWQLEAVPPSRRGRWVHFVVGVPLVAIALALIAPRLSEAAAHGAADPAARFLLAVAVIVFVSHLLGVLLRKLHQPPVIGEILGGLLLGPSALGLLWPEAGAWLFPDDVRSTLAMAAQLGLVVFMFLLGCELQFGGTAGSRKAVTFVVVGGMGLPFLAGAGVAVFSHEAIAGPAGSPTICALFFGLAVSITALPVLARILVDLRLGSTRIGTLALASAAAGDGIMWGALTVMFGLIGLGGTSDPATTAALAVVLLVATLLWVRPALVALMRRSERKGGEQFLLPVLVGGALAFAAATQFIGLHPAIGAFLFGAIIPREATAVAHLNRHLQGFAITILLPLFFASIGLSTSVGLLGTSVGHWLLFAAVLLAATAAKFIGTSVGARLAGLPRRDSLRLGALMNCRGVTELVVAAIGFQYLVISELGLTLLVLMALITTAATGPLMRLLGTQPEPATPSAAPPARDLELLVTTRGRT